MTSYELLNLIGTARSKYLLEAEALMEGQPRKKTKLPRVWLIAAILSTLLLLAGCVAYVLHLQDLSVGKTTQTVPYDRDGHPIEPEERIVDILTYQGHSGEPVQLAMKEWYDFREAYDPEGALMGGDVTALPELFVDTYGCYTQEMVDKLEEITEKYGVKLLDSSVVLQQWQWQAYQDQANFDSLLLPDAGAETKYVSGVYYAPGNLRLEFELRLNPGEAGRLCYYLYSQKAYFPGTPPGTMALEDYKQWNYRTKDGTEVLLALDDYGSGLMIADNGTAMTAVFLDNDLGGNPITPQELEQSAEVFDYRLDPSVSDPAALKEALAQAEAAWQQEQASYHRQYAGFDEFMKANTGIVNRPYDYLLMDLTGDGQDELIVGMWGLMKFWFRLVDGQVETNFLDAYLCEGNVLEYAPSEDEHHYAAPYSSDAIFGPEGSGEALVSVTKYQGQWYRNFQTDKEVLTEAEAQAVMDQYPRASLDWHSAKDYPLETGQTLIEYIDEVYGDITDKDRIQIYREFIQKRRDNGRDAETHFRLMDLNGDGWMDILFSTGSGHYGDALSYMNGYLETLIASEFDLCENNVLHVYGSRHVSENLVLETHRFQKLYPTGVDRLAFLAYDPVGDQWYSDLGETRIDEEEAQRILGQYPAVDPGMRPIAELLTP